MMRLLTSDWVIFVQPRGYEAREAAKELARRLDWTFLDTECGIEEGVASYLGLTGLVVVTPDSPNFSKQSGRRMLLEDLINGDVVQVTYNFTGKRQEAGFAQGDDLAARFQQAAEAVAARWPE